MKPLKRIHSVSSFMKFRETVHNALILKEFSFLFPYHYYHHTTEIVAYQLENHIIIISSTDL